MRKNIVIPSVLLTLVILLSMMAYATTNTITITVPSATGNTVRGANWEFNTSFTSNGDTGALKNLTIYLGATSGTAGSVVCSNTSVQATGGRANCKINFNGFNDNATMVLNVTIGNATGDSGNSTSITVRNDDTQPTSIIDVLSLQASKAGQIFIDCRRSSDNINSSPLVEIDLTKPDGTNATRLRTANTTASQTFSDIDINTAGDYTGYCRVMDTFPQDAESGTTPNVNTTNVIIHVNSDKKAVVTAVQQQNSRAGSTMFIFGMFAFIFIIIGIVVVIIAARGKKR